MELRNISTFLKVSELKSFSRAAEKLGYSQSNVSFQIQQLENELGIRLFERIGRKIEITPQGRSFLFYANEINKMVVQAINDVQNDSTRNNNDNSDCASPRGHLRIGSIESIATGVLPALLTEFHRRYPLVNVTVFTENKNILTDKVNNNQIDMFFDLNSPSVIPNMICRELRREEIVFICPAGGSAQSDDIDQKIKANTAPCDIYAGSAGSCDTENCSFMPLEQLCTMPFVLTEYGEGYRRELDAVLSAHGIMVTPVIEFGNPETIIQLVKAGIGMSFLPLFCVQKELEAGNIIRIATNIEPIYMYSQMFYHKNKWITPAMSAFFESVASFFGNNYD